MTIDEVFTEAGLSPSGPVPWLTPIDEPTNGVYVIAISNENGTPSKLGINLKDLAEQKHWIDSETVIYTAQTTKQTITKRLNQFYKHKYGDKRPHHGGQAMKLLIGPDAESQHNLVVYWAPAEDPELCEHKMLSAFEKRIGRKPFANRKRTSVQKRI